MVEFITVNAVQKGMDGKSFAMPAGSIFVNPEHVLSILRSDDMLEGVSILSLTNMKEFAVMGNPSQLTRMVEQSELTCIVAAWQLAAARRDKDEEKRLLGRLKKWRCINVSEGRNG